MFVLTRLLAVALVCTLAACDASTPVDPGTPPGGTPSTGPPPTPSSDPIGGVYSATITADGTSLALALDIPTTASGAFTLGAASTGVSTAGQTTYPISVTGSGTYTPPTLTLSLTLAREGQSQTESFTGIAGDSGTAITLRDAQGVETVFRRP